MSTHIAKTTQSQPITTVSQVIALLNRNRIGLLIWNPTANSVYIAYGQTCSATTQTAIVPANSTWSMPEPIYTGAISCTRNAGSGSVNVTELVI